MHYTTSMKAAELTRRREALGLSRAELAKRVGVSMPTVWRWETEGRQPIAAVAKVLEQTLSRLEKRRSGAQTEPPRPKPAPRRSALAARSPAEGLAHALAMAERCRCTDDLEGAARWEQTASRIAVDLGSSVE
jgi:transcriptional regulator with XRE-family HTH domain